MTDTTKPGDPADKAADGAFGGVTSHRAGYGDKLARVEDWVRRRPTATLASGEGAVLLAEIDRLRRMLVGYVNHVSEFEGIDYLDRESECLTQSERQEIAQMVDAAFNKDAKEDA
jgi:hypothetical protein